MSERDTVPSLFTSPLSEVCALPANPDNIKARVAGFYRKGSNKLDSTSGLKWRIYSWWWMRLLPLRRYLLFILYPHIPARFKKKTR